MACPIDVTLSSMAGNGGKECHKKILVARDLLDLLSGKWKMEVILVLLEFGKRRFNELQEDVPGISAKVLSSVLKDLEEHQILTRVLVFSAPTSVEYTLTEYGKTMKQTIEGFVRLGVEHRKIIMHS